jgi:hypothetical protein
MFATVLPLPGWGARVRPWLNRGAVRRRWEGAMIEEHLRNCSSSSSRELDAFDHIESPEYHFGESSLMKMETLGRVKRLASL